MKSFDEVIGPWLSDTTRKGSREARIRTDGPFVSIELMEFVDTLERPRRYTAKEVTTKRELHLAKCPMLAMIAENLVRKFDELKRREGGEAIEIDSRTGKPMVHPPQGLV